MTKYQGHTKPSGLMVAYRQSAVISADQKRARPGQIRSKVVKTIYGPDGRSVLGKLTVSEEGGATHIESEDRIDAIARPDTYRMKLTAHTPGGRAEIRQAMETIRTKARTYGPGSTRRP